MRMQVGWVYLEKLAIKGQKKVLFGPIEVVPTPFERSPDAGYGLSHRLRPPQAPAAHQLVLVDSLAACEFPFLVGPSLIP